MIKKKIQWISVIIIFLAQLTSTVNKSVSILVAFIGVIIFICSFFVNKKDG